MVTWETRHSNTVLHIHAALRDSVGTKWTIPARPEPTVGPLCCDLQHQTWAGASCDCSRLISSAWVEFWSGNQVQVAVLRSALAPRIGPRVPVDSGAWFINGLRGSRAVFELMRTLSDWLIISQPTNQRVLKYHQVSFNCYKWQSAWQQNSYLLTCFIFNSGCFVHTCRHISTDKKTF